VLTGSLIVLSVCPLACELDDAGDLFGGAAGSSAGVGNAGSAGASGAAGDGSGGTWPDADAAPDDASAGSAAGAGGAPDACQEQSFCADVDHDGYGDPNSRVVACAPPDDSWILETSATTCTDCFDQSGDVHPGSTTCVIEGYVAGTAPPSFDADCDGVETECGAKAAAQCGGTLSVCNGDGYLPAGSGQNPYCGSKSFQNCSGIDCKASVQSMPNEPLGCR
jgi:hypothetical protein